MLKSTFIFIIMIYDVLRKICGRVRKVMKINDFFFSGNVRNVLKMNIIHLQRKLKEFMKINEESFEKN